MSKRKTTAEFIQQAKEIHGDKYDYSLVDYKNNNTKVKIKCKTCGNIFEQIPACHINRKYNCPFCSKHYHLNKYDVLKRFKEIHGDKYDYSLVDYKNSHVKVKIICPIHGVFEQTPHNHFIGVGCPRCAKTKSKESKKLTTEEFTKRAKEIHNDKYDYSKVNYVNYNTKVEIICPIHGSFWQSPAAHNRLKQNCPHCKNKWKGEESIFRWLNNHGFEQNKDFIREKTFDDLRGKANCPLRYDFYIPSKNLLIEYNGSQHYKPTKFFKDDLGAFEERRSRDLKKKEYARNNNINLLIISYKELNNLESILEEQILR